ncbi:NAD(P)H-binding protein [Actinomadura barringtoniae]|uniref:NAD(P)H-binding protein n=1 Tax=Actinomadura barringtoniae TaxID=1427535 RepID=A0A939T2C5_9ACTN|nr:NAD(P)H-binding protein [Actinomadura barringtoniae]MBO2449406.1 NAD(P)H-binding protein [Actinomadura barringtoniae]
MTDAPILVLGARGKTGRRVADRLSDLGRPVLAASRTTGFDLAGPATWDAVLEGVDAVYLVPMNEYVDQSVISGFARRAVELGARRLVLLSARGTGGEPSPFQTAGENAVRASGADWTILRPSWFAQNFSEDFLLDPIRSGVLALPAGDGREAFIDAGDIADVAVAALTQDGHAGQVYELSGPEALTFAETAAIISEASGKEIGYASLEPSEFATALTGQGLPAELVEVMGELFANIRDDAGAHLSDGVRRVLGREPRPFADYAKEAAASGVWS